MLTVPAQIQALFKTDGINKNFRVHFPNGENADLTNADIISESVRFTESVCSKQVFQFGLSERSQIEFECVNVQNIYGMTIECGIEIDTTSLSAADISTIAGNPGDGVLVLEANSDIGYGFYRVPLGVFVVDNCPRSHGAMWRRQVTAYSNEYGQDLLLNKMLQTPNPFDTLKISQEAYTAMVEGDTSEFTESALTLTNMAYDNAAQGFYDSAGSIYYFDFNYSGMDTTKRIQTAYIPNMSYAMDFFKAEYTASDLDDYAALGANIAAAITAAGYDLTYNSQRVKVFDSNEAALKAHAPALFSPALFVQIYSSGSNVGHLTYNIPIVSDELNPVISPTNSGVTTLSQVGTGYLTYQFLTVTNVSGGVQFQLLKGTGMSVVGTYTVTTPAFTVSNVTAKKYTVTNTPSVYFYVKPTLTTAGYFLDYQRAVNGNSAADAMLNGYTYANALGVQKGTNALLELNAQFGRFGRSGQFERIRLDNSAPYAINTGEYSELWWDEYNISPVGRIDYQFGNGELSSSYNTGAGLSIYTMDQNDWMQKMTPDIVPAVAGQTPEQTISNTINTALASLFAPYVSAIAFTPADATITGLPYLEAGDCIGIDDGNGGTVETYILRRTMTGIQTLFDVIESSGGEIITGV